jgi:hypothetical protein
LTETTHLLELVGTALCTAHGTAAPLGPIAGLRVVSAAHARAVV